MLVCHSIHAPPISGDLSKIFLAIESFLEKVGGPVGILMDRLYSVQKGQKFQHLKKENGLYTDIKSFRGTSGIIKQSCKVRKSRVAECSRSV